MFTVHACSKQNRSKTKKYLRIIILKIIKMYHRWHLAGLTTNPLSGATLGRPPPPLRTRRGTTRRGAVWNRQIVSLSLSPRTTTLLGCRLATGRRRALWLLRGLPRGGYPGIVHVLIVWLTVVVLLFCGMRVCVETSKRSGHWLLRQQILLLNRASSYTFWTWWNNSIN